VSHHVSPANRHVLLWKWLVAFGRSPFTWLLSFRSLRVVGPYSIGTFLQSETPNFAWRTESVHWGEHPLFNQIQEEEATRKGAPMTPSFRKAYAQRCGLPQFIISNQLLTRCLPGA
jgi:hypothetical protein